MSSKYLLIFQSTQTNSTLIFTHHQTGIGEKETYTCVIPVAVSEPVAAFEQSSKVRGMGKSSNSGSPLQATPDFLGGLELSLPRLLLMFGASGPSQSPKDKLNNVKRLLPHVAW